MFDGVGEATHPTLSPTIPLLVFAMFQLKFAIITPALITGSFAERVRFSAYLLFMVLFSLLIYCPLAHWTWHPDGFLHKLGVLDFAGGTVVHMSAGFAALAGAMFLGRRKSHVANESHDAGQRPVRDSRDGHALVRLVRLQRGLGDGRLRDRRPGLRDDQHRLGGGDARLDLLRLDERAPSLRRSAPASAPSSAWWRSRRQPATSRSATAIVIGLVASVVSNLAVHWKPSRRSTTRSTSSPATASAG